MPTLTPQLARIHAELFGPHVRHTAPVPDAAVSAVLATLRRHPDLAMFRLWLVGSRLEPGAVWSDVDVVLSPCARDAPPDEAVARALESCRRLGLASADTFCVIDPCFRAHGPVRDGPALDPDARVTGTKLLSPRRLLDIRAGRIECYRVVARTCVEFSCRAWELGYYDKLPRRRVGVAIMRHQRPAREILR